MKLILEDGTLLDGISFGNNSNVAGEVVFNTAMTGYIEALTDPSYRGQILVMTYPLVGNYGVPAPRLPESISEPYESSRIQVQGLIVQNYVEDFSHYSAQRSLGDWLKAEGITAISGVDTRWLTRHLRALGTMKGRLVNSAENHDVHEIDMRQQVFSAVAPASPQLYEAGDLTVMLVDVGAKDNIVRSLLARNISVLRVPWHDDLLCHLDSVDGVMIGNGPGDPSNLEGLVDQVRSMLTSGSKPVMGICLGNQILARAAGAQTYKLPYGHRGVNQPVQDLLTRNCYITSQNHGYAVEEDSLPDDWEPWFVNVNDGSNEGIRSKTKPFCGVQFHPEAKPGPEDTGFLFDEFVRNVRVLGRA